MSLLKHTVTLTAFGLLVAMCLFLSTPAAQVSRYLGPIAAELLATFRAPGTQWMVFVCSGIYFVTFIVLQYHSTNARFRCLDNPDLWLALLLVLVALHYACGYDAASGTTQALTVVGGAAIGKGLAVLAKWKAQRFRHVAFHLSRIETVKASEGWVRGSRIIVLILLFTVASLKSDPGLQFQYRGIIRVTGPWENPNTFGMLMGVGLVLATGLVAIGVKCQVSAIRKLTDRRKKSSTSQMWRWVKLLLLALASLLCGVGLVNSYSRGAWMGAALAFAYLSWQFGKWQTSGLRGDI